jgi:TRAP-type mannitol/chloroaromatic compound transport system permease small subunit
MCASTSSIRRSQHRTKRAIDMFGCLFFMIPAIVITYLYAWFFMWRHLMTPNPSPPRAILTAC